jgi:hypothetical protein
VSNASHRAFCGLDGTTNIPTDVENSTLATGIVGMGWDAADANIQILHNDLSGVATKIDLGTSFPVPAADRSEVYELQLFSPNSLTQSVSYRVMMVGTGYVGLVSGVCFSDFRARGGLRRQGPRQDRPAEPGRGADL